MSKYRYDHCIETLPLDRDVLQHDERFKSRPDYQMVKKLFELHTFQPVRTQYLDDRRHRVLLPWGWVICFCYGNFDNQCASFEIPLGDNGWSEDDLWASWAKDTFWLWVLESVAQDNPIVKQMMWNDIAAIARMTTRVPDMTVMSQIFGMAKKYEGNQECMTVAYMFLYYGFIAEENKAASVVGKAIKLNAAHQLLIRGWSAEEAYTWCVGRDWWDVALDAVEHDVAVDPYVARDIQEFISGVKPWPTPKSDVTRRDRAYLFESEVVS